MNTKEIFEDPEVMVIMIDQADVIATSGFDTPSEAEDPITW